MSNSDEQAKGEPLVSHDYDYAHEAKAWYEQADSVDENGEIIFADQQAAAALTSIAASLIRIGDILEKMEERQADSEEQAFNQALYSEAK
jgi:hypothetical protein